MNARVRLAALAAFLAAMVSPGAGQGQTPTTPQTPTFTLQVDYVEVDVLVTDARGNYVRDLKREDFQVFEDGKPQTITAFTTVEIPTEREVRPLFAGRPIEPDVQSNERPFDGRVYVMLLDEAHTIPSNTPLVRNAARKFIDENFGANDLMAVISARGAQGQDSGQEFTRNTRLLRAAVDKFQGKAPIAATLNRVQDFNNTASIRAAGGSTGDPRDFDKFEREYNARAVMDQLIAVADWFGNVRGRKKTILFFSEGITYDIHDVFADGGNNAASMIQSQMQDLIRSATKANVSIYAIDPKGLQALSDGNIELQSPADAPPNLNLNERGLQNESRLARESLQTFSEETGGFAVVNTNGFAGAYSRIVSENSSYYVLAYYPPNPKRDGKFHKIQVRTTRPGLTVRARRGYANPSGKLPVPVKSDLSPAMRDALSSPLPTSGLTMKVFAAPFKGVAPNASVLLGIELRGRDMTLENNSKIELSFIAVDLKGKVKASSKDIVTLNLKPETAARVAQTGLRITNRMDVPPGRYQLRVAAHDTMGGAVGSVLYDLEVPDFDREKFSMSGLVLTSASASRQPTAKSDTELRQVLPGPPSAERSFPKNDQMAMFVDVYDNDVSTPHKVDITMTIVGDDGRVAFKNEEERSTDDLGGKRGGFGYSATAPLEDLDPGLYVLKVEARSRLNGVPPVSREVMFTVTAPPAEGTQK